MLRHKKLIVTLSSIATVVGGSAFIKDWVNGPRFEEDVEVRGKVAIVTGASSGIGYYVAHGLAERGAKVYLACRDRDRCNAALEEIILETGNKEVYCRYCDLASQESIIRFARRINKDEKKVDILVNNGGILWGSRVLTEDGLEPNLGVNHMGPFLLTNLLLDKVKAGAPSRIVNLASDYHRLGKINVRDLNSEETFREDHAYNQSKLAVVLFTRELAKRLEGSDVTVNAVNPGKVHSFFFPRSLRLSSWWPFYKSQRAAAESVINAALSTELKNVTGQYLDGFEIKEPSSQAMDDNLALWMWLVSEKWTKLADAQRAVAVTVSEGKTINTNTPAIPVNKPVPTNVQKGVVSVSTTQEANTLPS